MFYYIPIMFVVWKGINNMVEIFVFESKDLYGVYGYILKNDINLLPKNFNGHNVEWVYFKTLQVEDNEPPRLCLNTKEMFNEINKNGYYINIIKLDSQISE